VPAVAPVTPVEVPAPLGNDIIFLDDVDEAAPLLPPTPAVVEPVGEVLAYVSAPTGASIFTFGSGVRSFTSDAVADAVAPPRLPSPTSATPPPSPRAGARRRLLALGLPLASPSADSPTCSRGRHSETWSPAALELSNSRADGAAPESLFPGDSSFKDAPGGSGSRRR
jgi:hypothetical protein